MMADKTTSSEVAINADCRRDCQVRENLDELGVILLFALLIAVLALGWAAISEHMKLW